MKKFFEAIGSYFLFLKMVFRKPEKGRIFWRQFINESDKLILSSILLVGVISLFIGGVLVIQTASNLENPIIDKMYIGYMVRESLILEFCSTMIALILAGKMGSNISSEIGSMRITEQIDALEIMGVNSAAYLILPKIIATMIFFPFLAAFSMIVGMLGGYLVARMGVMIPNDFIDGLLYYFDSYEITYSLVKMTVFAFLITSISGFYGYYAKGNSLEVGKASTTAVVMSSIMIMIFNLILTQLLRT